MEEQYKLEQCSPEEVNAFNQDLGDLIKKHGVELRAVPIFVPNISTNKFEADAQVMVFKKTLIPKEDGAANGSNNSGAVPTSGSDTPNPAGS